LSISQIQENLLTKTTIGMMYLVLNNFCNFRCNYCFIENALKEKQNFSMMCEETLQEALNLYSKMLSKTSGRKTIILYGGEPFLSANLIRFCLSNVRRMKEEGSIPEDTAVTINTNGSLVTKNIADFLRKHNVSVSVSIDGPKEVHDRLRQSTKGNGTFEQAIRGFKILKEAGVNTGISCTVGDHNID